MSKYSSPFPEKTACFDQQKIKTGVLLTNLGTPDAPTASALRRYLAEFLSDTRVVEIPRLLWLIILHGIILRIRPAKSAKLYQEIWTKEGSPLLAISKKQRLAVENKLKAQCVDDGKDVDVALAMRYGNPSIKEALQAFHKQGIRNIIVMPLYPQYAGPTTGSTFDAVTNEIKNWRWIPTLHFISSYHDHPLYIKALASSITEHIALHGKPDKLLLSYHGMPKLFKDRGDPYYSFCLRTSELLFQLLQENTDSDALEQDDFLSTFQSRFGKAEWLKPYTDDTLANLAHQGHKHIAIISPAFSVDCLETLEELKQGSKDIFLAAGGETFHYISALNDREDHINAMVDIISPAI
jgi:ferrochelatase